MSKNIYETDIRTGFFPEIAEKILTVKCQNCKHMATIPGDAHVSCGHPVVRDIMVALLAYGIPIIEMATGDWTAAIPMVYFDPLGVKKGYVLFPINFDPGWLIYCTLHVLGDGGINVDNDKSTSTPSDQG